MRDSVSLPQNFCILEVRPSLRGLHSFTIELNLSNSGHVHALSRVIRWTEELKLS